MMRDSWDEDERAALDDVLDELDEVRRRHAGDPPLDVLAAAAGDALPPGWQAEVQNQLARSAWSRALVAGSLLGETPLDALGEARILGRVQQSTGAAARRRRMAAWVTGGALAATLLLAIALWPRAAHDAPAPTEATGPSAAVSVPTTSASQPVAVPTLAPLAFELPALQAPLSALTWRGDTDDNAYVAALTPAYDAYRAGDHRAADLAFRDAAEQFPDAFEVLYYGGITRLVLGRHDAAVASLSAAYAGAAADRQAEVAWYLAIAQQRAGQEEAAIRGLRGLCDAGGSWSPRACTALATDAADPVTR